MTKHIHYDTIQAWANGADIEVYDLYRDNWNSVDNPRWFVSVNYRVKQEPKPDIVHETSITLSSFAGPLLYASSPLEANCVLVFDGETGKLKECSFKQA